MKFIAKNEIIQSIAYFKNFVCKNDMVLGAFFVVKGIGFNNSEKHFYESWKRLLPETIWQLASIYDKNEVGKSSCFLFPFSIAKEIKQNKFFNPSTPLKNIASRFRDTTDNSLVDYYVEKIGERKKENEFYKFQNQYLQEVKNLLHSKIELKYFLIWVYRFAEIDDQKDILDEEETFSLLRNKFMIEFNFSIEETNELFAQNERAIELSSQVLTGEALRSLLTFDSDVKIDYTRNTEPDIFSKITLIENVSITKILTIMNENPPIEYIANSLKSKGQIILYGPPGTSKTYTANILLKSGFDKIFLIQFHPNTTYEDFIGGVYVKNDGSFDSKTGVLINAVIYAIEHSNENVLLLIDEINRGNITSILGEAIMALDRSYPVALTSFTCEKINNTLKIPDNLFIVGTMNSSDRSIVIEDKAILRRFHKIRLYPDYSLLTKNTEFALLGNFNPIDFLKKLNTRLIDELNDIEMQVGHAYLMPRSIFDENTKLFKWTKDSFLYTFNDAILPVLEEFTVGSQESLTKILGTQYYQRVYNYDKLYEVLLSKIMQ